MVDDIAHLILCSQLVMCDVDGTLVDTSNRCAAASRALLREFPPPVSEDDLSFVMTHSASQIAETFSKRTGRHYRSRDIQAQYLHAYLTNDTSIHVYPCAVEFLRLLRDQRIQTAAVTVASREVYGTNVAALESMARALDDKLEPSEKKRNPVLFDTSHYYTEGCPNKPDPAVFDNIIAKLGVGIPPSRTVMIGDSANDRVFAERIGAPFIQVHEGYRICDLYHQVQRLT